MLASTYLDLVLGLDIHFEMVPTPALVPMPIPNPFIGMVYDPKGLLIGLGIGAAMSLATGAQVTGPVIINLMPATNVGTNAKGMGHFLIPPGASWAPMPKFPKPSFKEPPTFPGPPVKPEDDAIAIQGSQTVNIMGASGVRTGEMFMSCGEPLRIPSSKVIAIPKGPPVMVGGPPAVNLLTAAMAMIKTKWVAGYLHSLVERIANDRLRSVLTTAVCMLTGHPVDVATGRVLTDHVDWQLPGPLPLKLERNYSSAFANRGGPLGHGWSHSLDQALWSERGKIVYLAGDGREIEFDTFDFPKHQLPPATDLFEPINRLTVRLDGKGGAAVTTHDGIRHEFVPIPASSNERKSWLRLKRMSNRAGHAIELDYDRRGNLEWVRDSGGRQVCFEHDAHGRMTVVKLPHPSEHGWLPHTRYAYDAKDDLVQVTDPLGHSWKFAYKNHLLVQETDRNGLSFYFAYDGHGQEAFCVRTWGDGGIYDHVIDYDKEGKTTFVTNSLGHTTTYKMNAIGCVTSTTDPLGHTTAFEYDERSLRKTKQTDATGRATEWAYDERGNCTKVVQPGGSELLFFYDDHNRLNKAVDGAKGEWLWTYNSTGQLIARRNPVGQVHQFDWRSEDTGQNAVPPLLPSHAYSRKQMVSFTDPGGNRTVLQYDSQQNLTGLLLPDGSVMVWRYDHLGRCIEVIDATGQKKRRDFDLLGRLIRLDEPDGNVRVLDYDGEGSLIATRDRLHDVRLTYQGMGRLESRSERGVTVSFSYDREEHLTGVKNEAGDVFQFVVDPAGLVVEEHGFDGILQKYTRDEAGRVLQVERPENRATTYQYDDGGRVVSLQHSDGETEEFVYRQDGQMIRAKSSASTVNFERDTLGRILADIQGEDRVVSTYGPLGLRTRIRTSLGHTLDIERNSMGDVVGLRAAGQNLPAQTQAGEPAGNDFWEAHWSRNQLGQEIERHLPGGVRSRWQRDAMGRPVLHEVWAGQSQVRSRAYTWEPGGRLKMIIDAMSGPVAFQYDDCGSLAGAAYAETSADLRMPDAVGNLFRRSDRADRQYDPAGKLLSATTPHGTTTFAYDGCGNLLRKALPDGREWRYEWSVSGRLRKVIRPDGIEVAFAYDALGRRISKCHAGTTTRWLWDGNVPIHEWLETGALSDASPATPTLEQRNAIGWRSAAALREQVLSEQLAQGPPTPIRVSLTTWVFEPETFAPVAKIAAEGCYSILADHLGAPSLMIDAAGHPVWSADLDSYGDVRDLHGERSACPFRWAGQYEDDETGLYYNRYRYYDPAAGTYISQDPIGLLGGMRPYGYVSDPNTWLDPFGLGCKQDVTRDEEGRITSAEAHVTPDDLGTGTGTNASSRAAARGMGQATDDAGHTIGRQLGGSGGVDSVFPQDPHINRGQFAQFENGIADRVRTTGQPVDISQSFNYGNGGTRPTSITYTVTQNGSTVAQRTFPN